MVSEIYRSFLPARWLEEYWQYYQWWWIWWWNRRRRKEFRCSQHELWDVSHISLLLQLPVDDELLRLNDRFLLRSIMLFTHQWRRGGLTKIRQKAQPPIHPNPLLSADDFSIPFQLREFFPNFPITQVQKESNYFSKIAFLVVICENTTLCYAVHV